MELNYKFENWEYKMLESFYDNPSEYFHSLITNVINQHKNLCIDKYIEYCKNNDLPIMYNSTEDLISKMHEKKLLCNLNVLNTQFLNNH